MEDLRLYIKRKEGDIYLVDYNAKQVLASGDFMGSLNPVNTKGPFNNFIVYDDNRYFITIYPEGLIKKGIEMGIQYGSEVQELSMEEFEEMDIDDEVLEEFLKILSVGDIINNL